LTHCHNKQITTGKKIYSGTTQACTITRHQCKTGEAIGLKIEVWKGEERKQLYPLLAICKL
jgi:hypothetical protein